jgi:hypothetical protein
MTPLSDRTALRADLGKFYDAISTRLERFQVEYQEKERREATRFNVFTYIDPDENSLSDVISDLLDPTGTHGQGPLFLTSLLATIGVPPESIRPPFKIKREDRTLYSDSFQRRIDITLEVGDLGIGIENKPWAYEGEDQLKDYMVHLRRKYGDRCVLVYLSGDGSAPVSLGHADVAAMEAAGTLKILAYPTHVHGWLERCCQDCKAENVRYFLLDLIDFVEDQFELAEPDKEATDEAE